MQHVQQEAPAGSPAGLRVYPTLHYPARCTTLPAPGLPGPGTTLPCTTRARSWLPCLCTTLPCVPCPTLPVYYPAYPALPPLSARHPAPGRHPGRPSGSRSPPRATWTPVTGLEGRLPARRWFDHEPASTPSCRTTTPDTSSCSCWATRARFQASRARDGWRSRHPRHRPLGLPRLSVTSAPGCLAAGCAGW